MTEMYATIDLPPRSIVIERYSYTSAAGKPGVQWLAQIVSEDGLLLLIEVCRTRRQALEVAGRAGLGLHSVAAESDARTQT